MLLPEDEFTSVLFPMLVQEQSRGIRVRTAPLPELAAAIEPGKTKLVAFSLVQMHSARGAKLREILTAAESAGAEVLVDATHAIPFVDLNDEIDRIDYLVCAAYKHLLSPRGVAFMHVHSRRWDQIPPSLANWRSTPDPYSAYVGGPLSVAPNAARYDISLAWFSWVGGAVSLDLLAQWQRQGLLEPSKDLAKSLAKQLGLEEPLGTVVSVPVQDAEAVRTHLARAGIKAAVRTTNVRLSTHVWNTAEEVDRAAEAIAPFVRTPAAA